MKENIEPGTAIIHVDYSESYRNKQQDEIQSAYFGQSSFSIFTACAYYKADNSDDPLVKRSLTIVSESSDHSRVASMSCVKMVIEEIEKSIALTKVIAWSDGMGAQFRSRFVFKILSEYRPDLDLEWHFNEAHHGKGPMDGIGGTIKNVVYRKVKTNKVIVNSAKEFQEAASKFVPSITSLFQTEEMLIKEPENIEAAPKIPDTLKIHKWHRKILQNGACKISFYFLSNDHLPYTEQIYEKSKQQDKNLKCHHEEREFESLALLKNTCAKCLGLYSYEEESEDWLKCPSCIQWFHESCF